jgi:hypothetical protein
MLEDRLGMREAEGKAAMERYRTTTGKKRRRRRQVNRLGQEEYLSETETEQSELDLAPEVQDLIVQESEMFHDKMEECEELKEEVGKPGETRVLHGTPTKHLRGCSQHFSDQTARVNGTAR